MSEISKHLIKLFKKFSAAAAAIIAILILSGCTSAPDTRQEPAELNVISKDELTTYAESTIYEENTVSEENTASEDSTETTYESAVSGSDTSSVSEQISYSFRNKKLLDQHFEKHGDEFDGLYKTAAEYEAGASAAANSPDALHKLEKEDGDDVYYIESTNEFVIVSNDGYLRTYFKPNAGKAYYDRQ